MDRKYTDLAAEVADSAILAKLDMDINAETAELCKIETIPTFHFYKDKKLIHEIFGADYDGLVAKIHELTEGAPRKKKKGSSLAETPELAFSQYTPTKKVVVKGIDHWDMSQRRMDFSQYFQKRQDRQFIHI